MSVSSPSSAAAPVRHAVAACLITLMSLIGDPGSAARAGERPYAAIVANLVDADTGVRTAFVAAAADAMAAFHEAAIREARHSAAPPDPAWVEATQAYVASLQAARAAAERGARVRFIVDAEGALRVIVGTRPARQFIIAAPRPHERERLEQAVAARFCARTGCGGQPDPAVVARHAGAPAPAVARRVSLGGNDGLRCPGDAAVHRRLQSRACKHLLAELRAVAAALRDLPHPVDWSAIGAPVRTGAEHELTVARPGHTVRLRVPVLFSEPRLLYEALPWMQAVLAGKVTPHVVTPPARTVYGAGLAASEFTP